MTADYVNVRSAPGTNSRVLYQVSRGTEMIVLGERSMGDSVWYRVQARSTQYPQAIGYMFGRYLRFR
ncbi:MAG TPA: SH3 domain-containing protein [Synechococcales cyanobacterium M55_K2018_004]|nr:SH3 domain-containing protein [Synechococcales cyanobacterium M55_K2018_004]